MQIVRSANRQNLMRLFNISGVHCVLIGVCVCAISVSLHIVIVRVNWVIHSGEWLTYISGLTGGRTATHGVMSRHFLHMLRDGQFVFVLFFTFSYIMSKTVWHFFAKWILYAPSVQEYENTNNCTWKRNTWEITLKQESVAMQALWGYTEAILSFELNAIGSACYHNDSVNVLMSSLQCLPCSC